MSVAGISGVARSVVANSPSITFSYTVSNGADRYMLGFAYSVAGKTLSAAQYAGTDLSVISSTSLVGLVAPATGVNTAYFQFSAYYADAHVTLSEYTGVDPTTPVANSNKVDVAANVSVTASSGTLVCPANGVIAGAFFSNTDNASKVVQAGTTELGYLNSANRSIGTGYRTTDGSLQWSGGGYFPSFTFSAAALNPVAAAAALIFKNPVPLTGPILAQ